MRFATVDMKMIVLSTVIPPGKQRRPESKKRSRIYPIE